MRTIGLVFPKGKPTKNSKSKEEVVEKTEDQKKATEEHNGDEDEIQK